MGVIDLNARVKALEEAGSADIPVIDELEATVTALDEQINGDGETDLGLTGDVAALETAIPTAEDISSQLTGAASCVTSATLHKYGNLYELSVLTDKTATTTLTSMVTLPVAARPTEKFAAAASMLDITDVSKRAIAIVNTDGTVTAAPNQALANTETAGIAIHATWIVIPTPTT